MFIHVLVSYSAMNWQFLRCPVSYAWYLGHIVPEKTEVEFSCIMSRKVVVGKKLRGAQPVEIVTKQEAVHGWLI